MTLPKGAKLLPTQTREDVQSILANYQSEVDRELDQQLNKDGEVYIQFDDGTIVCFSVSEWGGVEVYTPKSSNPDIS